MFKSNIDTAGRILRLVIGLILLSFAYYYSSWILLAIALFTFFEAAKGWCVFYQLMGKNSCPINNKKE